ncbi:hypothetical protein [Caulobacter segnis]|uniref:Uncharacterized protein n=1 Tax=Caulobacter segnis (strain ATCC 21756 / DSM 7131 / JCM 7823 / NBRC 15250 / LMG 17158 / TK0059) TaxID=509190 RepID=D5VDZ4_CAUST|nr:hypothetical protein [Caulobacter segnis]ADG08694.1 hypothetical protein Cseg_0168 [Caulobacter segnis ATCC 21756]
MLKPGDGSVNWPALISLVIALAFLATLIWRAEMGEEVTMNVRGVGQVPVVANGASR